MPGVALRRTDGRRSFSFAHDVSANYDILRHWRPHLSCIPASFDCDPIHKQADLDTFREAIFHLEVRHGIDQPCNERIIDTILGKNTVHTDAGLRPIVVLRRNSAMYGLFQISVIEEQ